MLQPIVGTSLIIEHVNHDIAEVQQDPAAFLIAFPAKTLIPVLALHHAVNFVADGMQLTPAGARHEHEVIKHACKFAQVKNDNVPSAAKFGGAGRG